MEKILIFPLNSDTRTLLSQGVSALYEIVAVSSYPEDKKELDELQKQVTFYCSVDFEKCLSHVDSVVFAEETMGSKKVGYKSKIEKALKAKKKVYLSEHLAKNYDIDFYNQKIGILQGSEIVNDLDLSYQEKINIPIISVVGMGENSDKFNLQVKVKKAIEKQGYKVLFICSNVLGSFLGAESIPGFVFSEKLSLPVKIGMFNHWLYNLQKEAHADVILLGCPGGILEFDEYESNYYGEACLVISNAVPVDIGILTIYRNLGLNTQTMEKLSLFCQEKYGLAVEDFVIAEQIFKIDHEFRKIRYYQNSDAMFDTEDLMKNGHVAMIENDEMVDKLVITILKKLENNIDAI